MKTLERNNEGLYSAVVYAYTNNLSGDKDYGKKYIGATIDESTRRCAWNTTTNPYSGKKIADARKRIGVKNFAYTVLEVVTDADENKLIEKLINREEFYIRKYDTVENGYNSRYRGSVTTQTSRIRAKGIAKSTTTKEKMSKSHRASVPDVKITYPKGIEVTYSCLMEAAKSTGFSITTIWNHGNSGKPIKGDYRVRFC